MTVPVFRNNREIIDYAFNGNDPWVLSLVFDHILKIKVKGVHGKSIEVRVIDRVLSPSSRDNSLSYNS